jgi:hypothetical protein
MTSLRFCRIAQACLLVCFIFFMLSSARGQAARLSAPEKKDDAADVDHEQQRAEWFSHGRVIPGKSAAELRHRAYEAKMRARAMRAPGADFVHSNSAIPLSSAGGWTALGPVPLSSDASGTGFQDYRQVAGRATAVAIDPADSSGNTVLIGGAQGGMWKSTNGANSNSNNVSWIPLTDDEATLSIGAIAIQPGNSDLTKSVILAGTGEADNSADSYFGLGILRSADGGNSWTLISTANSGALSFSGLGATRMAFSTASGQAGTVVAAMASTAEGVAENALTANTLRGLYTSTDAGQSWTYISLFSGGASQATSATSVAYNASAGLFFAAVRYHGFYSSPDGLAWTQLAAQPGAPGLLSPTACPQNYSPTCPIYRGEITVVPGRNEMYVWFISLDSNNNPVDQGIWETMNAGASWTQVNDSGITNCEINGNTLGCGVQQGYYNLELLAVPSCPNGGQTCPGNPTDLYAGAINLYKCSINSSNTACGNTPFMNLTHVYGCNPLGAPAHVHPDQHALAYLIQSAGTDLMYFANDGGVYRALDGFSGLTTGSCFGANQFDDLNQNLGSMTQFVSFSEHASNIDTFLGGTQDNGSPSTVTGTTSSSWVNVLSGDGGYSAIDSATNNWFASAPDYPPGGGNLDIQECSAGVGCNDTNFFSVINSFDVGGDDGAFYFPYVLDPQSAISLLLGTCRVWRGPRAGGSFVALSLNFETFGTGTCAGTEVNVIRALASGGASDANGSKVIYATTDGLGPNNSSAPIGGNVWVTTNATAVLGTSSTFAIVTLNGPGGGSINPNQFPVSAVAVDTSDSSGDTAYVTVMGFTGGTGHVWQTRNAGATWIDFSGSSPNAIPDSPANAVVIDPASHIVYVGTDVGVFQSATATPAWTEVGAVPGPLAAGFLPNVAVTALALFNSGGQKLLRVSTYGRGIWQFDLLAKPDFQISFSNTPLTAFPGTQANFAGTITALNGYNYSVGFSCIAGTSAPPAPCTPSPASLTPTSRGSTFVVGVGTNTIGDYNFNLQAAGSDPASTTHPAPLSLHVVNFGLTAPFPGTVTDPRGEISPPVSFQITTQGSFNQNVTLTCSFAPIVTGATCSFTPGAVVTPDSQAVNMTASVMVPFTTATGKYEVTLQAATQGTATLSTSFAVNVVTNPDFSVTGPASFPNVKVGSSGISGVIAIASQDGFSGTVALSCPPTYGAGSCSITPTSVSTFPATASLVINGTSFTPGNYQLTVQGSSGIVTHSAAIAFSVGDYQLTGPATLSGVPGGRVTANLSFASLFSYSGHVNATCDTTALPAAPCSLSVPSPITIASGATLPVMASFNVPNSAAPGSYNININTYDQDSGGTPSHALTMALTVTQDFTLGALTPATQTITPGQSASYNFNVLPVGSLFPGSVSLSCSGGPAISLCTFTPASVTPGNGSAAVLLTISTTASSAALALSNFPLREPFGGESPALFYALWLSLPAVLLIRVRLRFNARLRVCLIGLFLLGLLLTSCGGGGSNGGSSVTAGGGGGIGQQQGTQPGTYLITVTASSGTLSHQAPTVTLIVSP